VNFLGIDVRGLDLETFFAAGRIVYVAAYVGWLVLVFRGRRHLSVAGPVVLTLLLFALTTYPLLRPYGLSIPSDRLRHLWWGATAAAGNPPWESGVVGQRTLEPVWSLFVSLLAGRDPARVVDVYAFLPALGLVATGAALAWAFRGAPLRALFAVFFVLLAATQPLDSQEPFRNFWARHFLLKPNHALGLALVPVILRVLAAPLDAARTAGAALLLGLLGWVFVVDWALVCGGLACFLALCLVRRPPPLDRREVLRLAAVLGGAMVIVLPYVIYLAAFFPHAVSLSAGTDATAPLRSPWGDERPQAHSLLLLATFDLGPHFPLALYGAWASWRRGRRGDLLWLGTLAGGYLAWAVTMWLYASARARAADEVYFFLAFVVAVHAGLGAAALVRRAAAAWRRTHVRSPWRAPQRLAAVALLAWLPFSLGWWWDPRTMDAHFAVGMNPLPANMDALKALASWLRTHTQGRDIVWADPAVALWVPALSGRRIVPPGAPVDPPSARARWGARVVVRDGAAAAEAPGEVFRAGSITAHLVEDGTPVRR
jgi:hypothetical protein